MKTTIQITFLCVLSFCLLGCRSSSQPDTIESITDTFTPAPQSASATVVAPTIPLSTATKRPTATLTITPTLVQIPKSTFDASQAMIQTPFPPVQCPLDANISLPDLDSLNKSQDVYEKTIIEILNAGGIENVIATLSKSYLYDLTRDDLTHDGVPELITENRYNIRGYVSVFGCDTGQYKKMLTVNAAYDYAPSVMKIRDMNLNGVPDLALVETTCHYCTGVMVYEWDGQAFQSLIREWFIDTSLNELTYYPVAELAGYSDAEINDTDGNGTCEIILKGGFPSGAFKK